MYLILNYKITSLSFQDGAHVFVNEATLLDHRFPTLVLDYIYNPVLHI